MSFLPNTQVRTIYLTIPCIPWCAGRTRKRPVDARLKKRHPGNVVNIETGGSFTRDDPCVESGVMVGYHGEAHSEAINAVATLLRSYIQPSVTRWFVSLRQPAETCSGLTPERSRPALADGSSSPAARLIRSVRPPNSRAV